MWTHLRRTALERIGIGLSLSRQQREQVPWLVEQGLVERAWATWEAPSPTRDRWTLTDSGVQALHHGPLPGRDLSAIEVSALRQYAKPPSERADMRRNLEQLLFGMRLIEPMRDEHGFATKVYALSSAGAEELRRHAAVSEPVATGHSLCICGHRKDEHTRGRGSCGSCYAQSDHGLRPYCSRYRKVG
jgi:DNA-binding PadR family transcriptional regulator